MDLSGNKPRKKYRLRRPWWFGSICLHPYPVRHVLSTFQAQVWHKATNRRPSILLGSKSSFGTKHYACHTQTEAMVCKVTGSFVSTTKRPDLKMNYNRSLRSAADDLRSQSEFLFTSHVFKLRTCTQLHFHWIKRGNVSRVTVITSNYRYVTKQLKRDWLELLDVKVLLQRSISKPCI